MLILEQLAATRSREMVKLLTEKYGYKQISIESLERVNDNEKVLPTCIDPDGEHDEIWWGKRFFPIANILFDSIWEDK